MSEELPDKGPVEYDKDRLASDPEYREQILQDIASSSSTTTKVDVTRGILYLVIGLTLFTVGLFLGGRIGERYAFYTALLMSCFLIFPMLGFLLYYRYES